MKQNYWISFLAGLNIIGFLTLPIYYGAQLLQTNPLLWLFVPDCQLSALFIGIALISKRDWIKILGFAMAIKYGLWTVIVMLSFMSYYLTPENAIEYWIVVISHIVLFIEAFIIRKQLKWIKAAIPIFVFLFLSDLSDYLLGTHPPLPDFSIGLISVVTPFLTFSALMLFWFFSKKEK